MKFAKNRVEAISDGVIAIIMTIMVLNIPLPARFDTAHVLGLLASVLVFFVSFFVVGFFWHQHYQLFHEVKEVTGRMSWRNLLFLFALSLMPVFTKWVIENLGQVVPAAFRIRRCCIVCDSDILFQRPYIARRTCRRAILIV